MKHEIIEAVKKFAPLRSKASWNKMTSKELKELYNEGVKVGVINVRGCELCEKHWIEYCKGTINIERWTQ